MSKSKAVYPGYEFGASVIDNLKAMSEQRDFEEVKSECGAAFSDDLGDDDPLRAALDFAKEHDVKCLVVQDDWFMIVPGFKTNMAGWINCFKIWESIDEQRRIKKASE